MDDLDDEENELELNDTDKLESWITWDRMGDRGMEDSEGEGAGCADNHG